MQIVLSDLSHAYPGGGLLFDPISTAVAAGESLAITGPSGSGKTTLLAAVAGLITPSHGGMTSTRPFTACWITQSPHGVPARTVLDHVAWSHLARGMGGRRAAAAARRDLATVGMAESASSRFSELSGGQAQRVMLARGLAARPDVLLIDEPTAQLDSTTARDVNRAIGAVAGSSSIVIVATHSLETLGACDRALELRRVG